MDGNRFLGDKNMQSRINFLVLVILSILISVGLGQNVVAEPEETAVGVSDVNAMSFPYVAEVTADNVNLRSGPGTNYYRCGKLNKTDRIKVVGSQFSWSRVVPPEGSFSWISKQYVQVDPNNSAIGTVTGDAVRVYAGSELIKPIHSTTVQVKLNVSDKVGLLGDGGEGGYYKIVPPIGSYLWISTEYSKALGLVGEVDIIVAPAISVGEAVASVETKKLREYYALQKQIDDERAKPASQQNYTDIKKAFVEIAENEEAGKAARYSKFAVRQIGRFELASTVAKEVKLQDAQLLQARNRIEKARMARLAEVKDYGKYTAVGLFQVSKVYGEEQERKHYRVVDDAGKTVCYALPGNLASGIDLDKFIDLKVGLIGTVEPHLQTSGALVRFDQIVELK